MTIRPGAYPWPNRANEWRPMHIHFSIFGHGVRAAADHPDVFRGRPADRALPDRAHHQGPGPDRPLVAPLDMAGSRPMDYLAYKFDIVLRGGARRCSKTDGGDVRWFRNLEHAARDPVADGRPYVHIGCIPTFAGIEGVYPEDLGLSPILDGAKGEVITITGSVYDGTGWALRDAMMESWQADAEGIFPGHPGADPKVTGFCRFAADKETGEFTLRTVKPGGCRCGAAAFRRRTSPSGSWRAASTSAFRPASTSRTTITRATRC
jgi:protocatechuate 3,4-dioxygenase beta subunit